MPYNLHNLTQSHSWKSPRCRSSSLRRGWIAKVFTRRITTGNTREISSLLPRSMRKSNRISRAQILLWIRVWDQHQDLQKCFRLMATNIVMAFWRSLPRRRLGFFLLIHTWETRWMTSAHSMILSSSKAIDQIINSWSTAQWNQFRHRIPLLKFNGQPFLLI
jgi:hypothetical protein